MSMDTSKEYIKMCEKAVEVQALWEVMPADFIYHKENAKSDYVHGTTYTYLIANETTKLDDMKDIAVWLPRQDQLQGMVSELARDNLNILMMMFINQLINIKVSGNDPIVSLKYSIVSIEQLWLVFVMSEKYGKTWNTETLKWEVGNETDSM